MSKTFKVYQVEGWPGVGGFPLIVTTAYRNDGDYPRAEWFVAIPDPKCTFFGGRLKFPQKSFPVGAPVTLDDDFLFARALDEAKGRVWKHLCDLYDAAGERRAPPPNRPRVEEDTDALLVSYFLSDNCEHLKKILRATEDGNLQSALRAVFVVFKPIREDI